MEQERGLQNDREQYHSVQLRAYSLWEQRGRPWGTPEIDWLTAERELHENNQGVMHEPPAVVAAKVVGSVLGTMAGLVTSVTDLSTSE